MKVLLGGLAAVLLGAGVAVAEDVPVEVTTLGGNSITLHKFAFLSEEENNVLGLVASDMSALTLFVPEGSGFAALAASPDDGFIRGGVPVASAIALSGLTDAETARADALAACEAARVGEAACVVLLEVAPAE